ncbi:MAG: ATP-binding protein [Actinomycetota bacterium]
MTATEVQVRFAAEFTLFLVALSGFGFVVLRPDLLIQRRIARAGAAVAFVALAVAALSSGALVVDDPDEGWLMALRAGAVVVLGASAGAWHTRRGARHLLAVGVVALAVAEALVALDQPPIGVEVARGVGALGLGACLVAASTRAISARIATSAAAIVLVVITALAVALSSVVTGNVEDEAVRRYGARADTEAQATAAQGAAVLPPTQVLASALSSSRDPVFVDSLRSLTEPGATFDALAAARPAVAEPMAEFLDRFVSSDPRQGPTLLVNADGAVVLALQADPSGAREVDPAVATELGGSAVVSQARELRGPVQSVAVVAGEPLAVAAAPITLDATDFRGVVVLTSRLDDSYLAVRAAPIESEQTGAALALVGRQGVLSDHGPVVDADLAEELAQEVIDSSRPLAREVGDRFVSGRVVEGGDGAPVMALLLSVPRSQIEAAREDLYRVLFLVAMGAAAVALAVAIAVGERIGVGLRRLTAAATAIREGDLDASAQVRTDDELGVLGSTFDAMADSLRTMTDDLRRAADDEAALRGRLEAVVAGMGEALVAVDRHGVVTDFNAAAEELADLPATEARGRAIAEVLRFVDEDGADQTARLQRPVLDGWTATGSVTSRDGAEVPVVVSAGTLRGPGNDVSGAVFVLRDVRRERELERMKTEFLANISHELRTPLTPIKGFASILQTRELPRERAQGFAEEIGTAADQLERVIGQLVNFATAVGGRLLVEPEPLPPRPVLDEAVHRWQARVDGTHQIVRRVAKGTPPIPADRAALLQALDELLDNAVKYSPGGGRVVVAAAPVEAPGGPAVEVSVSDQGVGIPPERLGTMFDDFSQADASATRRFGGLGLGQALVHRIVRAHGGELTCESEPGQGARVAMTFPLAAAADGGSPGG